MNLFKKFMARIESQYYSLFRASNQTKHFRLQKKLCLRARGELMRFCLKNKFNKKKLFQHIRTFFKVF